MLEAIWQSLQVSNSNADVCGNAEMQERMDGSVAAAGDGESEAVMRDNEDVVVEVDDDGDRVSEAAETAPSGAEPDGDDSEHEIDAVDETTHTESPTGEDQPSVVEEKGGECDRSEGDDGIPDPCVATGSGSAEPHASHPSTVEDAGSLGHSDNLAMPVSIQNIENDIENMLRGVVSVARSMAAELPAVDTEAGRDEETSPSGDYSPTHQGPADDSVHDDEAIVESTGEMVSEENDASIDVTLVPRDETPSADVDVCSGDTGEERLAVVHTSSDQKHTCEETGAVGPTDVEVVTG